MAEGVQAANAADDEGEGIHDAPARASMMPPPSPGPRTRPHFPKSCVQPARREADVLRGAGATGVQATRQAELDRLACCLADGSDVCLVCVCFPRRCHAQEVAFELARRATEIVRQRSCKRSL